MGLAPKFDHAGSRLHERAMQTKLKHIQQKNERDLLEIEEAYMMAQKPKARPLPKKIYKDRDSDLHATKIGEGEVRTLDQFMEDQIKFEQKKYEKLKNAIMREESEDIHLYQP